jgi:hypothetical protein
MSIFHACTSGVQDGRARCRNERGKCSVHHTTSVWAHAPQADVILVKVNVNEKWEVRLRSAGIATQLRSFDRAQQLEAQHVARATSLGRNAYAARDERDHGDTPEAADSGCPVFGKTGLAELAISAEGLRKELFAAGYVLTGAHMLKRYHKPPVRLVMEFSKPQAKPALANFPWTAIQQLLATTFNQVDVWANDRDPRTGNVVHTVNCGKRADGIVPQYRLHFADGDWDAEPVASPAPVLA